MEKLQNQERIVTMHQMLFEMARGNFNSRIPLNSDDDELETVIVLINMVAEEMKESIFHGGYINTHSTGQFITQTTFVVDTSFFIKSFTSDVTGFLGYLESELIDQPLADMISANSFRQLQEACGSSTFLPITITLDFRPKVNIPVSVCCSIAKLINRPEIILNLVIPVGQDSNYPLTYKNNKQIKARKIDALLIQKLYDYILGHLDDPLPSLKILSGEFGTNEHKLKDGFRHFFKTSIYQFYNDERLKRAYFMIEHTAIPLKNISIMNGFNDYPNFSKSFKRRFGFSPYELKRKFDEFI